MPAGIRFRELKIFLIFAGFFLFSFSNALALTVSGIDGTTVCPFRNAPQKCVAFFKSVSLINLDTNQQFIDDSLDKAMKQTELGYIPKGSNVKIQWSDYGNLKNFDHYYLRYACADTKQALLSDNTEISQYIYVKERNWSIPKDFSWYRVKNPCYCKLWVSIKQKGLTNEKSPTLGEANTRPFRICPIEKPPSVETLDPDYSKITLDKAIIEGNLKDLGINEDRLAYENNKSADVWFEYRFYDPSGQERNGMAILDDNARKQTGNFVALFPEKIQLDVAYEYRAVADNKLSNGRGFAYGDWKSFILSTTGAPCGNRSRNVYFLGGNNAMPHSANGFLPVRGQGFEKFNFYFSRYYIRQEAERSGRYSLKEILRQKKIDTVVLRYCCPLKHLTEQEIIDLEEWLREGGKLIRYTGGCADCDEEIEGELSGLFGFIKSKMMGGILAILENNTIIHNSSDSRFYTDISKIKMDQTIQKYFKQYTNIIAQSSGWNGDLTTDYGEYVHAYRKYGKGLIIYNGLSLLSNGNIINEDFSMNSLILIAYNPGNGDEPAVLAKIWQQELLQPWGERADANGCGLPFTNLINPDDFKFIETLDARLQSSDNIKIRGKVNDSSIVGQPFFGVLADCSIDIDGKTAHQIFHYISKKSELNEEKGFLNYFQKIPEYSRGKKFETCVITYKTFFKTQNNKIYFGGSKFIRINSLMAELLSVSNIQIDSAILSARIANWGEPGLNIVLKFNYWMEKEGKNGPHSGSTSGIYAQYPDRDISKIALDLLPGEKYCFTLVKRDEGIGQNISIVGDEYKCFETLADNLKLESLSIVKEANGTKFTGKISGMPKGDKYQAMAKLYPQNTILSDYASKIGYQEISKDGEFSFTVSGLFLKSAPYCFKAGIINNNGQNIFSNNQICVMP